MIEISVEKTSIVVSKVHMNPIKIFPKWLLLEYCNMEWILTEKHKTGVMKLCSSMQWWR